MRHTLTSCPPSFRNLHNATVAAGVELDFFVLFSSVASIVGQLGQANYASANTFLSSMAHYRNRLGLPASVVDIGAVQGVGIIENIENMERTLKSLGFTFIDEAQLLDSMLIAMTPTIGSQGPNSPGNSSRFAAGYAVTLGLSADSLSGNASQRLVWRNDRRMAVYHNSKRSGGSGSSGANEALKTILDAAKDDASTLKTPEAVRMSLHEMHVRPTLTSYLHLLGPTARGGDRQKAL